MTTDQLLALARGRGLRIERNELRPWLRTLVRQGWLVEVVPDDFEISALGRRHFVDLREADVEPDTARTPPVGAVVRRRVEE